LPPSRSSTHREALAASIDFFIVAHVITPQLTVAIALAISGRRAPLAWCIPPALAGSPGEEKHRAGEGI
jgi:hypothetical protein